MQRTEIVWNSHASCTTEVRTHFNSTDRLTFSTSIQCGLVCNICEVYAADCLAQNVFRPMKTQKGVTSCRACLTEKNDSNNIHYGVHVKYLFEMTTEEKFKSSAFFLKKTLKSNRIILIEFVCFASTE